MALNPRMRFTSDSSEARDDMKLFAKAAESEAIIADAAFKLMAFGAIGAATGIKAITVALTAMHSPALAALSVVRLFGPRGLAMALGASTAAASIAVLSSKVTIATARIGENADAVGLTTDQYQAISRRAVRLGEDMGNLHGALETARERFFDAQRGAGAFSASMERMAPDILELVNAQDTQEQKLQTFISLLATYPNEMDRARLAQAAFGEGGLELVRVLSSEQGGLRGLTDAYSDTTSVITNETIRMAMETERRWEDLINRLKSLVDGFGRTLQNVIISAEDLITTDTGEALATKMQDIEDRIARNMQGLMSAQNAIAELDEIGGSEGAIQAQRAMMAFHRREIERLNASWTKAKESRDDYLNLNEDPPSLLEDNRPGDDRSSAREREGLEAQAARYLVEQNDISRALKMETEQINLLKAAGLLTDEQAAVAIRNATIDLSAQTPIMRANKEAIAAIAREAEEHARQQARASELLERQRETARLLADAEARRLVERNMTAAELREADIDALERLIELSELGDLSIDIDADTVTRELARIEEAFAKGIDGADRYSGSTADLERALGALTTPLDDFESAAARAAQTFVSEFLGVDDMLKSLALQFRNLMPGGGDGFNIGGAIAGVFGFGGGEGVGTPPIVPEFHGGGMVGQPYKFRNLATSPPGPHESLILAQKGERVMKPGETASAGGLNVTINAEGADREGLEGVRREVAGLRAAFSAAQSGFKGNVESSMAAIMAERGRLV
ncbi:MAG: hypothetical protein AAFY22_14275 [Pseudomonadota bacterium]